MWICLSACVHLCGGPSAKSAFHVREHKASRVIGLPSVSGIIHTGPPAQMGFPHIHNRASSLDWLPNYTYMYILIKGLPLRRASLYPTIWPPALSGVHLYNSRVSQGLPQDGLPTQTTHSPRDSPPSVICRYCIWASCYVGLPSHMKFGLPPGRASVGIL